MSFNITQNTRYKYFPLFGIMYILFGVILISYISIEYNNYLFIGIASTIFGAAVLGYTYLQRQDYILKKNSYDLSIERNDKEELDNKIEYILNEIKLLKMSGNELSKEQKKELIDKIEKGFTHETINDIFNKNFNRVEKDLKKVLGLYSFKESFFDLRNRIINEIYSLKKRANINLIIGGGITLLGLSFLGLTVITITDSNFLLKNIEEIIVQKEMSEILLYYVPRVLLVIFIEIFAYFFLKLYKHGLDEIKYFQNELTNIESKLIAIEVAYITKNEKALKEALNVLVQTERNFILRKGETTVELERAKSESENMQNILKAIPGFLKNKGK